MNPISISHFRDTSIRNKVMLVTLAACLVALFSVAGGICVFQLRHFRKTFGRELQALSRIMAENCAVALAFDDAKTAQEVLSPLGVKPEITQAGVLGPEGKSFASFGQKSDALPPRPGDPAGIVDRGATWTVVEPIVMDGNRIGTFFMHADFATPRGELQRVFLYVTGAVLAGSLLLVVLLTTQLQKVITGPIQLLAGASNAVARDHDYSVRVSRQGNDEVGVLTEAFNQMLGQIQMQDSALQAIQIELSQQLSSLQHEIAERKAAEEALRLSQQELLETSRLAGMAEVATGVLHNVGNVLNSVNISASVTMEKLRVSKVASLGKAAALMAGHAHDLGEFLTKDPQGQRLPPYLQKLSEHLVAENAVMLFELDQLARNIEHIKEIVAMQQSYACVTGVLEDVPPEVLIEDALRINTESFARHGIAIVRRLEPAPPVRVDKHKVLQILINLLRNAKHAVEATQRPDPRIGIGMTRRNGSVQIEVADNGVGIEPQNMAKVFRHGFTTKKNGHGFGLHSGALAAKEMGGSLCAASAGPGLGATFTLALPVAASTSAS